MPARHKFASIASILAVALVPAPAMAQDKAGSAVIEAFQRCLAITEDAARLACHDAAARRLVDAAGKREGVVVDQAEVTKTRRSLFGFPLPRIKLFGNDGPDTGESVDRIESKITKIATLGYGKYRLTMDDGAVWTTLDTWTGSVEPRAGAIAEIKRASLGSYMLQVKGGRTIRVVRSE